MRGYQKLAISVVVLLVAASTVVAQESALQYFADDIFMVVEVDFNGITKVLPPDMMADWKEQMVKEMGMDISSKIDTISLGFTPDLMAGSHSGMYGIMKGSLDLDTILAAIKAQGKEVNQVQIGSVTAYTSPEEAADVEFFITSAGPGAILFGPRAGIEKFQEVKAGARPSAASSALMKGAAADAGTGGIVRLAGVFPEAWKSMMAMQMPGGSSLTTFAVNLGYENEFLSVATVLAAEDAGALEQMKMMAEAQLPMFKQMDTTGAIAEVVDNMKIEVSGNKMFLSTGLSKAAIDKLIEQFGAMFGGMAGY